MIYSSWELECDRLKLVNYGSVFALLTPTPHPAKNLKNQNFEKMKKLLEISFYTCVTKTTIIWGTASEIEWDRRAFFVLLGHFLPFYPPSNPEYQSFEKMKKAYEDVIILYMCTENRDHMVDASWDMGATHIFLSFWIIFCPFTPLLAPKVRNWKKQKEIFPFSQVHNK